MDVLSETLYYTGKEAKNISEDYVSFLMKGSVIIIAAGVCIGVATKDVIQKLLDQVLLPFLQLIAHTSVPYMIYKKIIAVSKNHPYFNIFLNILGNTIWLFLTWSIIVFVSYLFLNKLVKFNLVNEQLVLFNKATNFVKQYMGT